VHILDLGDILIHWREDGDPAGRPVVFANALGTDLRLWDGIMPLLPESLRLIRCDMRGHGLSACPPGPYAMGALVRDAERLLDALGVRDCVFVGLSIGGMIAQGLAVKRLDLVRAMVLSNTATKIATPGVWAERIAAVRAGGIEAVAEATMQRWFPPAAPPPLFAPPAVEPACLRWQRVYLGAMAAISGADFYTPTSGLTLPTLAIADAEDRSTPPDLVRETAELIKGARFELIRGAGHLPPVDRPEEYAGLLRGFLHAIGHV